MKKYVNIKTVQLHKTIALFMSLSPDYLPFLIQFKGTNLHKGLKK